MSYSTVVHYFENNQVTAFTLDRNTSIITLTLKEGKQELPETTGAPAASASARIRGLKRGRFGCKRDQLQF